MGMFVLVKMKDSICIHPQNFDMDQLDALTKEIESKYCNKVIADCGLCICLFEFCSVGDAHVYPSDGSAHVEVTFRLLVFRPFVNEVIVGRIRSCSKEGLTVSLGFFEDILIPPHLLQQEEGVSAYDPAEKMWIWRYSEEAEYPMYLQEKIRFKVTQVAYTRISESAKGKIATETQTAGTPQGTLQSPELQRKRSKSVDLTLSEPTPSAMQLVGRIDEGGLGLCSWW